MVQVEHRKRFAGEDHLVVVQPDGTLALIPAWMSEETARSTAITSSPCLSIDRLVELRVRLDALLASSDGESAPHEGGDHATTTESAARPVRSRSKDVGHSELAEDPACQPGCAPFVPTPRHRSLSWQKRCARHFPNLSWVLQKAIPSRNSSPSGRTCKTCQFSAWPRKQKQGLLSVD